MGAESDPQFWRFCVSELERHLDACRPFTARPDLVRRWQKSTETGRTEYVTEADLDIERVLVSRIKAQYPDSVVISEETQSEHQRIPDSLCFVIDPIDGTIAFIRGETDFATSVAVVTDRKPIAGVVDFPARRETFKAVKGFGADLNGRRLKTSETRSLPHARIAVSPNQLLDPRMNLVKDCLRGARLVPIGAATGKLTSVANGEVDAAFYLPSDDPMGLCYSVSIWDFLGAAIVLLEAGGAFRSLDGADLMTMLPRYHRGGWVASNDPLEDELLAALGGAMALDPTNVEITRLGRRH